MTTNSPNPVDGDVQALIEHIKEVLQEYAEHGGIGYGEAVYRISLAALTAEPDVLISEEGALAIRAIINREISGAGRYVIFERPTFTGGEKMMPLYTTPPAQLLRPVDLSQCKKLWYEHDDLSAVIVCIPLKEIKKVLRQQGYEVKS